MIAVTSADHLVVRPSGVWDSRAPLHNFWLEQARHNRLVMGHQVYANYVIRQLSSSPADEKKLDVLLGVSELHESATDALASYRRAFGYDATGTRIRPTISDFLRDVRRLIRFMWESAVTSYLGVFEVFVQCWALNYLLAILENGGQWSRPQTRLAVNLSPIRSSRRRPGVPHILGSPLVRTEPPFPDITQGLRLLPNVKTDPRTGKGVDDPLNTELNAFTAIDFWRSYRNCRVHRRGVVTTAFVQGYARFWDQLAATYPAGMPPLEPSARMSLNYRLVTAVFSVHYRSARWLNEQLLRLSSGRRGHLLAPADYVDGQRLPMPLPQPAPLLMDGDHAASLSNMKTQRARRSWSNPWLRSES